MFATNLYNCCVTCTSFHIQVARVSRDCVLELAGFEDVIIQIVKTLADQSLDLAKSATEVLVNLGNFHLV